MSFDQRAASRGDHVERESTIAGVPGKRTLTEALTPQVQSAGRSDEPAQSSESAGVAGRASYVPGYSLDAIFGHRGPFVQQRADAGSLQRKGTASGAERADRAPMSDAAAATIAGKGAGSELPGALRGSVEAHLGANLGGVRVHSDDNARQGAATIGARAFTHGHDVFLGAGETVADTHLMAHELTHVVQQGATGSLAPQAKLEIGPSDDPAEHEADRIADAVVAGRAPADSVTTPAMHKSTAHRVQRQQSQPSQPTPEEQLAKRLDTAIEDSDWENKLRPRLREKEETKRQSRHHAELRRQGQESPMTGMGSRLVIDAFVRKVKELQRTWTTVGDKQARAQVVVNACNDALEGIDVPRMEPPGVDDRPELADFDSETWRINFDQGLLILSQLTDAKASELADTALHESRHCEQWFLVARYLAGRGRDAQWLSSRGLLGRVAQIAANKPLDVRTNSAEVQQAQQWVGGFVESAGPIKTLKGLLGTRGTLTARRDDARQAVVDLRKGATTMAEAESKLDLLTAEVEKVENAYTAYRATSVEADAHDVGVSAALGFEQLR